MTPEKILSNQYAHPMERLKDIMAVLRGENGCPWDREQTHKSLIPCLLEESYEVVDTIEREDFVHMKEELGDLLFQSVFHSRLAEESGHFSLEDVIQGISEKLIHRHPHVFAHGKGIRSSEDVVKQWEAIKDRKNESAESILDSVPVSLPAIQRSEKIQSKAAKLGLDWENWKEPVEKLWEEVGELRKELEELSRTHANENKIQKDKISCDLLDRIESELGDVLFSIVNVSRHLGIDPEKCLRKTNDKFSKRIRYIESESKRLGKNLKNMSLEEIDELWNQAKRSGF